MAHTLQGIQNAQEPLSKEELEALLVGKNKAIPNLRSGNMVCTVYSAGSHGKIKVRVGQRGCTEVGVGQHGYTKGSVGQHGYTTAVGKCDRLTWLC